MITKMNRWKISHRLGLMVGLAIACVVAYGAFQNWQLHNHLFEEKRLQTQQLVESAHAVLAYFHEASTTGKLSEQDAKHAAAAALESMRYGASGYFWINDFTPRVVMHPHKPDIIGKDMSNNADAAGKYHWNAFVDVVKRDGGGFVDYMFMHNAKGVVAPKVSYVKGFEPWGWIVGTGIYVDDVDAVFWDNVAASLVALALLVVLLSALSILLARSVTRPLCHTVKMLKDMADGKAEMLDGLDVSGTDEMAELAGAVNRFIAKLRSLINALMHSTESLAASTQEVNDIAGKTNEAAGLQKSESDQVATAMTELYATAGEVASISAQAADAVTQVNDMAREGQKVVETNDVAITGLNADINQAAERMRELQQGSESIGGILVTIRGIADQTNLLALNAAIEAARAGDQGRGFAVVADEVRTLAQRTQDSTSEIEKMISTLQEGTVQAVAAVEGGRSKAESSVERARKAGHMLAEISEAVERINEMNTQIATAAEEQSRVVGTINENVVRISDIADRNAQGAAGTLAAAASMGERLNELMEISSGFKLGKADAEFDFSRARSAHLSWVNRVQAHLDGKQALSEDELVSHHHCVLGKWYYGEGMSNYGHIPAMQQMEAPHAHLHETIRECLDLKNSGDEDGARRLLQELDTTSKVIVTKLNEVEEQIAAEHPKSA